MDPAAPSPLENSSSPRTATPASQNPALQIWTPQSDADKAAVVAQLEHLLAHPLFSQSKRYPVLLRFVVEQTLAGNADQVKERSIGMEVFNRPPNYDANADPVVRVTAGEIRKRLAQYYYDPAHTDKIRIELPTGSYVPIFQRRPEALPAPVATPLPIAEEEPITPLSPPPPLPAIEPPPTTILTHHPAHHLTLTILLTAFALALGLIAGYWYHRHTLTSFHTPVSPNQMADQAVDDFWQPLTAGPATVTFCLGEPARDATGDLDPDKPITHTQPTEPLYFRLRQSGLFALADVVTLTRITEPLQKQHKSFRISAASEASFAQLREGPAVLIGAFDNLWTMRLTRNLRFGFDSVDGTARIVDRKSQSKTTWTTAWDLPNQNLTRDYAILARYRDSITGQPIVLAAGISEEGTEAAGEFLANPTDLANLLSNAPPNWRSMNIEAVIETQVIEGHAGPPRILAVEFW